MKLGWYESWTRRLVQRHMAETRREVESLAKVTIAGDVVSVVICIVIRVWLPDIDDELGWGLIASVALIIPVVFLLAPLLLSALPYGVTITDKGVMFLVGNRGTFVKYERISEIGFACDNGFRVLRVTVKDKKGGTFKRCVVASPKVAEAEVAKLLVDAGQA